MATKDIFSGDEAVARLKQLPPDIQNLIYSADMTNIIRKIGNGHHLHIDQIGTLESETSFLMLGFTEQKDFVRVLSERLPTDMETASQLAAEVHDTLLVKIRESLHRLYPESVDPVSGERQPPSLRDKLAGRETPPPLAQSLPKIASVPPPVPTPPASAPPAPQTQPQPAPHPLAAVDDALRTPQLSSAQPVDVGGPATPPKPKGYATDPYLEPI